jgi:hypothetical protein
MDGEWFCANEDQHLDNSDNDCILHKSDYIPKVTSSLIGILISDLSTPLYLHGRNEYPHPLEARVKNLQINGIGVAQFQGKLIFPNDSYCSKQWWIPVDYPTGLDVSWLAVEKGGYLLDGTTQLVAGTGSVSGTVTKIDWQYKFGTSCNYPTQEGDTDYAPSAVFELQTTNNGNYFLNVRTTTWWYKTEFSKCSYAWSTGRFFLEPHDGIPEEVLYNYATETLGYLLYDPKQQVIDCLEGTKIQFGVIDVISDVSVKLYLPSGINLAQDSVGVFASVIGYHGGDSVSPTSYGDTSISSNEVYLFLQVCLPLCFCSILFHPLPPSLRSTLCRKTSVAMKRPCILMKSLQFL